MVDTAGSAKIGTELARSDSTGGALTGQSAASSMLPAEFAQSSCLAMLRGDRTVAARNAAADYYPKMRKNVQAQLAYGTRPIQNINGLVNRLFAESMGSDVSDLATMVARLNVALGEIIAKYDPSDPAVAKKYGNWRGGSWYLRMFGLGKTISQLLTKDAATINVLFKKIEADMRARRGVLLRLVGLHAELRKQHDAGIRDLVYHIAVMEELARLAADEAEAAASDRSDAADALDRGERQADLAEWSLMMSAKVSDYKIRLFVALGMRQRMRNAQTMYTVMIGQINQLIDSAIPTMALNIAGWKQLIDAAAVGRVNAALADTSNAFVISHAQAETNLMDEATTRAVEPLWQLETVQQVLTSTLQQTAGVQQAIESGAAQRADNDAAIARDSALIQASPEAVQRAAQQTSSRIAGSADDEMMEFLRSL